MNWAAASFFDNGESFARRPAEVDERASSCDSGTADAAAAVNADVLAGADAAGKPGDKDAECEGVERNIGVGEGMGEELDQWPEY